MYQWVMLVGVLASCVTLCCGSQNDLLKNYKINELGENTAMWCNESIQYKTAPNGSIPISWMLPNLTILYSSNGRFMITNDNWTLTVENVTVFDLGQYNCILQPIKEVTSFSDWYLARLGLNIQGPYFDDLWDKYETNTIIGISAGFGFLAMAIATMLVYHFRYQPDQGEDTSSKQGGSSNDSVEFGAELKSSNKVNPLMEPTGFQFLNKTFDQTEQSMTNVQTSNEDGTIL